MQQLALNQVERQNAANPAVLHFHILAAFFLDDHVRIHGSYRIEALGPQHFQINGNAAPCVIKLLIGVIRVNQWGSGNHRIQFLTDGRFLTERIHLFGMLHQAGAQIDRQSGNGLTIRGDERLYVGIVAHHGSDVVMVAGVADTVITEQLGLQTRPGVPIFLKLLDLTLRNATEHRSVHIPRLRILG